MNQPGFYSRSQIAKIVDKIRSPSQKYFGQGQVLFVDGFFGADTNHGDDPMRPLRTIAHALALCIGDVDEYIIVLHCWQQETFPIAVNKKAVHIIGLSAPDGQRSLMVPALDTAIFTFAVNDGAESEISGFSFGAGAAHGCIEFSGGNDLVWVHNCAFGHMWSGGGQDGIRFVGTAPIHGGVIEDNWFYGTKAGAGKLSRHGIIDVLGVGVNEATFRNNHFLEMPGDAAGPGTGGAIYGTALNQCVIANNMIAGGDPTKTGWAIYLAAASLGCLVAHNEACDGVNAGAVAVPFVDDGDNNWMCNQHGETVIGAAAGPPA